MSNAVDGRRASDGFTLIELSIVLVIVGLIVGGIMMGKDLIASAAARAQISQIARIDSAALTFRIKYAGLPGDVKNAAAFGFITRGFYEGQGDGNGIIMGNPNNSPTPGFSHGFTQGTGETAVFWRDLSDAELLGGTFATADSVTNPTSDVLGEAVSLYLPRAAIDSGSSIAVYSENGYNRYVIQRITGIRAIVNGGGVLGGPPNWGNAALSVSQAFHIDAKLDDGFPQSGNVLAEGLNNGGTGTDWAGPNGPFISGPAYTNSQAGNSASCFDNGGSAGAIQAYSMGTNAQGRNCTISIRAAF